MTGEGLTTRTPTSLHNRGPPFPKPQDCDKEKYKSCSSRVYTLHLYSNSMALTETAEHSTAIGDKCFRP